MPAFGFAHDVPPRYTSEEWIAAFERMGHVCFSDEMRQTLQHMRIASRCACISLECYLQKDDTKPDRLTYPYFIEAIRKSLSQSDITIDQIDGLITSTSTPDYLAPSLNALVVGELKPRQGINQYHLGGAGCAGSLSALNLAFEQTRLHPEQLWVVAVGDMGTPFQPSMWYFRDQTLYGFREIQAMSLSDSEKEQAIDRSARFFQCYLFGDAATVFCVAGDAWWAKHGKSVPHATLQQFAVRCNLSPEDARVIYFEDGCSASPNVRDGRIRYHMGSDVTRTVQRYSTALLEEIPRDDYDQVFIHTGSHKIIRAVQELGGWQDSQVGLSDQILSDFANVSQACLPLMWERYAQEKHAAPKRVLNIGFGIGFMATAAVMEFNVSS